MQTNAPEGVDQPAQMGLTASQFGETALTKISGEGTDHPAEILHFSQFGETTLTRAHEGGRHPRTLELAQTPALTHIPIAPHSWSGEEEWVAKFGDNEKP